VFRICRAYRAARRKDGLKGFFWPRSKYGSSEDIVTCKIDSGCVAELQRVITGARRFQLTEKFAGIQRLEQAVFQLNSSETHESQFRCARTFQHHQDKHIKFDLKNAFAYNPSCHEGRAFETDKDRQPMWDTRKRESATVC